MLVPNFLTTQPAAKLAIIHAERISVPADKLNDRADITVSPAPVTSLTSDFKAGISKNLSFY